MVTVSSAWQDIYNAISSNVSDPKSRGTKWIFGSYPDVYAKDFPGFPLIIIHPVDVSEETVDFGISIRKTFITADVEIFSKSAEELDNLTDSVISACRQIGTMKHTITISSKSERVDVSGSNVHLRRVVMRWQKYG